MLQRAVVRRELINTVFVASMLITSFALIAAGLWYLYPKLPFVRLGSISNFPPSDSPYWIEIGEEQFFVVNTGDEVIVYVPRSTHPYRCRLIWRNERFEDPCMGAYWTLKGDVISGPAFRKLDRFMFHIHNNQLEVELWNIIEGEQSY